MELEGVARGAGAVREGEVVERSRKAHEVARPDRQRLEAAARPRPAVSAGAAGCAREGWERAGAYPASRRLCSDAAHHSAHPPGILLFHSRARKPALRGEASLRPRATRVTAAATAQRPARA